DVRQADQLFQLSPQRSDHPDLFCAGESGHVQEPEENRHDRVPEERGVKAAEGLQFSRFIGIIKLLTGGVHCRCKIYSKGVDVMNITISGKNIEVTDGLRAAINDKLGKLERYFTPETEVIVTLSVEKERQKIEVTIPVKGSIIRSEQVSNDMYVSIDLVEEVIER